MSTFLAWAVSILVSKGTVSSMIVIFLVDGSRTTMSGFCEVEMIDGGIVPPHTSRPLRSEKIWMLLLRYEILFWSNSRIIFRDGQLDDSDLLG